MTAGLLRSGGARSLGEALIVAILAGQHGKRDALRARHR